MYLEIMVRKYAPADFRTAFNSVADEEVRLSLEGILSSLPGA
jgi:hypothetical protein